MFLTVHPMEYVSLNSCVFDIASSNVADFNTYNKLLAQKHLKQSYQDHKLHKTFSLCYL